MYAQKFGSLPIAHRTGGLADTIEDGATGFLFSGLNSGGLAFAVKRALATFASKHHITKMRLEAMSRDFTWGRSVNSYIGLYHSMR
jgi:starch synthase